jgi:hypothetical protein
MSSAPSLLRFVVTAVTLNAGPRSNADAARPERRSRATLRKACARSRRHARYGFYSGARYTAITLLTRCYVRFAIDVAG